MIKGIFKIIVLLILAAIIFLAISLWQGGKPFRWFGQKSEKAGEILKEKSEEIGKEADKIKERKDDIKDTTKKVSEGLRKTGDKIKDIAGPSKEK